MWWFSFIRTMMAFQWLILILLNYATNVHCFPKDTSIFEFGSKDKAYGGLRWDYDANHPKPYPDPVNETLASLFQYLTPETLPSAPFPTSGYSLCWSMNMRLFTIILSQDHQTIMRLFHEENQEWSSEPGDYWHSVMFSPSRGTLIIRASMVSDKSKRNIWSGGLGVGNYSTEDNPLLRWSSICMANDFETCRTRYFIGM